MRCAMIHILRQPGPFCIDLSYNSGLICFPSFRLHETAHEHSLL
jgi:hypothetical protein